MTTLSGWQEERRIMESWFDSQWAAVAPAYFSLASLSAVFSASAKTVTLAGAATWDPRLLPSLWIRFGSVMTGNLGPFKIAGFGNGIVTLLDPGGTMANETNSNFTATVMIPWFPHGQVEDTPIDGGAWIEMAIMDGAGNQITLGSPATYRYVGVVQFRISVAIAVANGGKQLARAIGDILDGLWSNRHFATTYGVIRGRVGSYKELGMMKSRFEAVFSMPFWRDEQRPLPAYVPLS